ncbi:trimeric intracellular cation channel family protein [Flavobacterium sp.]|uniref:trimeric intracellular cation channel family protein n=1 Tax=Flavobacterium sp. TaxID=239 RepID=UPI002FDA35E8
MNLTFETSTLFYALDGIGTLAFAISGVLTAFHKKLDLFGVFIIAFVTAVGGGTLRDVLIGRTPVGWMTDLNVVYTIVLGFAIAVLLRTQLDKLRKSLFLFDTIGLGVFTLIGLEKGINSGLHPVICIALGTMTACFGGVIRDILCNEIPIIFRREIYATVCIVGGLVFFTLKFFNLDNDLIYVMTTLVIISIRLLAVRYHWYLPKMEV